MTIIKLKTTGMRCSNCEKAIERAALGIEGVRTVKSSYAAEETAIEFDGNKTSLNRIIGAIESKGYKCAEIKNKPIQDKPQSDDYYSLSLQSSKYLLAAGGVLFLFGLFWLISYSFRFNLPEFAPNMGFAIIFTIGLLTSFHCVGMCGGFVLSYTAKEVLGQAKTKTRLFSHLQYGIGKTITYAVLGALFGLLGSFISFTPMLKGIAALLAGAFLLIYGLNMLNVFPWLRRLQLKGPRFIERINKDAAKGNKSPFIIGLLNGLMVACGPLQAMLIYAAGTGSMIEGALSLLVFGIGTLPLMLGFGSIATLLGSRFTHKALKASAFIVIILGVVMVNRGLALTGTGYDFNTLVTSVMASGNGISDTTLIKGYQEIKMDVTRNGWQPNSFVLKKGVPVKWVIDGKEITGCNRAIQVPKLGLKFDVKQGEQTIEFVPEEEGIIPWSCWMGMLQGTFVVKENIGAGDKQAIRKELSNVNAANAPKGSCGAGCGGACGGGCGCGRAA